MLASVPVQCPCHVDPLRQPGNLLWGTYELGQATVYRRPGDGPIFSVVGWYALTLPQDPKFLSEAWTTMMAPVLASGIDAQRPIIFHQDENHAEPTWILSCITVIGKLTRMTVWKVRLAVMPMTSQVDGSLLMSSGSSRIPFCQLRTFLPIVKTIVIQPIFRPLLNDDRATHVPVREDQQQHLELTRDLAEISNIVPLSNS